MDWKKWADERPTDIEAFYMWRVSPRTILGLALQPEWKAKLALCGVGHGNEWWPDCSHWDGWRRSADPTLEWRLADKDEPKERWNGLYLKPCPFTGEMPKIEVNTQYITAPIYKAVKIRIFSSLVSFGWWSSAFEMQRAWNARVDR